MKTLLAISAFLILAMIACEKQPNDQSGIYGYYQGVTRHQNSVFYDPPLDTSYIDTIYVSIDEDPDRIKINNISVSYHLESREFDGSRISGQFYGNDGLYYKIYSGPDGSIDITWNFRGTKCQTK